MKLQKKVTDATLLFLLRSKVQVCIGILEINNEVESKPAFSPMEIKAELPSLELKDDGEDPLKNGHPPWGLSAPPAPPNSFISALHRSLPQLQRPYCMCRIPPTDTTTPHERANRDAKRNQQNKWWKHGQTMTSCLHIPIERHRAESLLCICRPLEDCLTRSEVISSQRGWEEHKWPHASFPLAHVWEDESRPFFPEVFSVTSNVPEKLSSVIFWHLPPNFFK